MTLEQAFSKCYEHNGNKFINQFSDENHLEFVVVFSQDNFDRPFTEQERSYSFRSDNKRFISGMIGNSIFMDCLDGQDLNVRLDWYLGTWKVENVYQVR